MRRRFVKISLILLLPLLPAYFYYRKISFFYKDNIVFRTKMDYLYHGTSKPDILFLGSSRTFRHIDPRIIDPICHVYSYNLGMDALNMAELRMMLYLSIEQGKIPRTLVLNIDPSSFEVEHPVFNFVDLLPYASRDTVVYQAMASVQEVYKWKWKYPFYRMQLLTAVNDGFKVDALVSGTDKFRRKAGALAPDTCAPPYYKGFMPECDGFHETKVRPFYQPWEEKGFGLLKDIIDTCKRRDIRLVLVVAPMYKGYDKLFLNGDELLGRAEKIAKESGVPFFNMIRDSLSMDKQNFYNLVHLNRRAASIYSTRLAYMLKALDEER